MSRQALEEVVYRARCYERVLGAFSGPALGFVRDRRPKVAAKCGRRAGKSHGDAGKLLLGALMHPNEKSVFIGVSAGRADEVLGRAFRILQSKNRLDLLGLNPTRTTRAGQLFYEFPNGHLVWVAGCKNRADAEKFRGDPYVTAIVDEGDSMRGHLKYLVQEVLEPTMMDFNGQIVVSGTPGVIPEGFFYDITTGNNQRAWPTHSWTVLENPHVPNAEAWLQERYRELGLDPDSPSAQREWMGRWVLDLDSLCYQFDTDLNIYPCEGVSAPILAAGYHTVIGVDLGVNDATAMVANVFKYGCPDIFTVESQSWVNLSPSGAYVRLREMMARYPNVRVVADTGGQGKSFVREWQDSHGFSAEAAVKVDAAGQIALLNGLLRSDVLRVHDTACRGLIKQALTVPWDDDRKNHAPDYEDHELDAWRYGVLAIRTCYLAEPEAPIPGTPEAQAQEHAVWKQRQLAKHTSRKGLW